MKTILILSTFLFFSMTNQALSMEPLSKADCKQFSRNFSESIETMDFSRTVSLYGASLISSLCKEAVRKKVDREEFVQKMKSVFDN